MLQMSTIQFIMTALSGAVLGGSVAVWAMGYRVEMRDQLIRKLMDTICSMGGEDEDKR